MQALIAPQPEAAAALPPEPEPARAISALPTPRAAAVAVTALLAFGVMLGSVMSPTENSAAQSPIVVALSPPAAKPAPAPAPAEEAPVDTTPVETTPVETTPQQQVIYVQEPQSTPPASHPTPVPVPPPPLLPSVSHMWIVMLTGHGYEAAFGPNSQATYLSKTLTTHGELIPNYYAIAHGGLANEIAMISGQSPTKQTAANCPQYGDVTPGTPTDQDQVTGDGCVYPAAVKTVADQLFTSGNTWKAYVEGAGSSGCDHATTSYETWRNPFLYFHSVIDNQAACTSSVVDLSQLQTDLQQVGDTPGISYIVPNSCHNGSDTPCAPDQPAGLAAADAWLQTIIPQIEASPGYKQGGLIAITFDQAPKDGPEADSTACCGQPETYPNLPADDPSQQPAPAPPPADQPAPAPPADQPAPAPPADQQPPAAGDQPAASASQETTPTPTPTTPTPAPPTRPSGGGGKVGLLLISPFIKPNTINETGYYNHFSLFASTEDVFGLPNIAYANLPDLTRFDRTVFTAYNPSG
ncbi:MAG TPA: alkaline phosphatase family protein [Thermoleophilaceae bacterium]|nr:alkaline phosphatase family protein [Thermoleophilaceae bacterium]